MHRCEIVSNDCDVNEDVVFWKKILRLCERKMTVTENDRVSEKSPNSSWTLDGLDHLLGEMSPFSIVHCLIMKASRIRSGTFVMHGRNFVLMLIPTPAVTTMGDNRTQARFTG